MTETPDKVGVGLCSFMLYLYRMHMKCYRSCSMPLLAGRLQMCMGDLCFLPRRVCILLLRFQ